MTKRVFIDTNVFVYARDPSSGVKSEKATQWLVALAARDIGYANLQVMNEFARVLLKRQPATPLAMIKRQVEVIGAWGRRALTTEDVSLAWAVREALGFQWFDCLLLASASNDGCDVFLSEDMVDGARFGDLVIVNPFLHHPDEFLTPA